MTLCTLLVISLLILTNMQHVLLYSKALNRQEYQHQNFYQMEDILMRLTEIQTQHIDKNCFISEKGANQVIGKLVRDDGCLVDGDTLRYRYLIEDLGEFPCLVVKKEGELRSTHHIRITLLQRSNEHNSAISVLQVRDIKAIASESCQGEAHRVSAGISSWRYIPDVQYQ
ncbi:type II secretion system protein [Legionella sp. km535]|uniref:type II secretion system protein n=1 Tax=Legionella sp. km535 TaxID=2498107 RepID=UPI000F8E6519|nr:type II secretion system protein [Legionella sp. km535]RUR19289.1 type II secretion system protein [Legionella sp. km535]